MRKARGVSARDASMTVHPGELVTVMYEVVNTPTARECAGHTELRTAERHAAFQEGGVLLLQAADLEGHEARQMPVVFYIDPALPKDVKTITLSYTFFEVVGGKQRHAKAKGRHGMNKQASFLYSLKAVLWSFFGLRRKRDFDRTQRAESAAHHHRSAARRACFIGTLIPSSNRSFK
jgi:hypothetical protein